MSDQEIRRRRVVTLCGSSRFFDAHMLVQMHLSLKGYIVIPLSCYGHVDQPQGAHTLIGANPPGESPTDNKVGVDQLHFDKISMSDAIFVVNVGNYIGESTQREIDYAKSLGLTIYYLFDPEL